MSYFCPNCGGFKYLVDGRKRGLELRSSKKIRLDVYKCGVCHKTYLIKVLKT